MGLLLIDCFKDFKMTYSKIATKETPFYFTGFGGTRPVCWFTFSGPSFLSSESSYYKKEDADYLSKKHPKLEMKTADGIVE